MKRSIKKQSLSLSAALLLLASSAAALATGYTGPGASPSVDTVAAALQAADDTPVVLTGHITEQLRKKHYSFKDDSGTIEVEIKNHAWPQQPIGETTQVRLHGEVEHKKRGGREVEVDRVEIVP